MKRIIYVLLSALILLGACVEVEASGSIELIVEDSITANVGVPFHQSIHVYAKDKEFRFVEVAENDDVTSWLNLPAGDLKASIISIIEEGYELEIEVRGTAYEECDDYIIVTVPKGHIENYMLEDLANAPLEGVVYDITYLPVSCYYTEPSTIEGTVGEAIDKQYVYIKVEGDNIDIGIEGETLAHVNGMDAVCEYLDLDENVISVYFIGMPEQESHDLVDLTLPAGSLETNHELSLHVPFREDVLYDINPRSVVPEEEPYVPPISEPAYEIPYTGVE